MVIAWPTLEAEQAHFKDLIQLGWHRYVYDMMVLSKMMKGDIPDGLFDLNRGGFLPFSIGKL
jgi:hypothetical protein